MVMCPQCNSELDFEEDELDEGEEFTCDECGANVQVVSVDPMELEPVNEDEDDDAEDGDFDEEDKDGDEDEDSAGDEDEEEGTEGRDEDWR